MSEHLWQATLVRVRSEFAEMPCIRISAQQACALFGLPDPAASWVLERLVADGFLTRTAGGEYTRRTTEP